MEADITSQAVGLASSTDFSISQLFIRADIVVKSVIIILIVSFTLGFSESKASTLFDSLNSAYLNNLKLNAERANLRASKEEKRESISEFLD